MKKWLLLFLFCCLTISLFASPFVDSRIEPFINHVYNQDLSLNALNFQYETLKTKLKVDFKEDYWHLYQYVLLDYYMGRAYQFFPTIESCIAYNETVRKGKLLGLDKYYQYREEVLVHQEKAMETLLALKEQYFDLYSETDILFSAEVLAMEAEIIAQLCLFKNFRYSLANFTKVDHYAKEALKLDSSNPRAILLYLSTPVYSVAAYGGDAPEALEELNKIDLKSFVRTEDLFNYYLSYGYTYIKLNDLEKAKKFINKARTFYPRAIFPQAMLKIIAEGGF